VCVSVRESTCAREKETEKEHARARAHARRNLSVGVGRRGVVSVIMSTSSISSSSCAVFTEIGEGMNRFVCTQTAYGVASVYMHTLTYTYPSICERMSDTSGPYLCVWLETILNLCSYACMHIHA